VVRVAGGFDDLPLARWTWDFSADGATYRWAAETAQGSNGHREQRVFVREQVTLGAEVLIELSESSFAFRSRALPKLDPGMSAISLLGREDTLVLIEDAMDRVVFSVFSEAQPDPARPFETPVDWDRIDVILERFKSRAHPSSRLEASIGVGHMVVPRNAFVFDLFLMQEAYPEQFDDIRERFCDVFPSVDDVRIVREVGRERLTVEIHETSGHWVLQARISSGMLRTLVYLCGLGTAPSGSVILIDEFEASLRLNCRPAMTDALLARGDCQFIVTSHHPYVINNIPIEHWKLVERRGSAVSL